MRSFSHGDVSMMHFRGTCNVYAGRTAPKTLFGKTFGERFIVPKKQLKRSKDN